MRFDWIKKTALISGAALSVSVVGVSNLHAQGTDPILLYLQQIASNTSNILQQVNGLQTVLANIMSWTLADDSKPTAILQGNLNNIGIDIINNYNAQMSYLQPGANPSFNDIQFNQINGVTPQNAPYANDLAYSTVLGIPYWTNDPRKGKVSFDPVANFITNASAIDLRHTVPGLTWQGQQDDIDRYQNYFNNAMAVESFGAFALSNLYADNANGFKLSTDQQALLNMVNNSNSNWFNTVASENIGYVLRQLLMFQSEAFVLMTQMLQTEKQMLTAQVMTNTLILTLNQQWETNFVSKAQGLSSNPQ